MLLQARAQSLLNSGLRAGGVGGGLGVTGGDRLVGACQFQPKCLKVGQ